MQLISSNQIHHPSTPAHELALLLDFKPEDITEKYKDSMDYKCRYIIETSVFLESESYIDSLESIYIFENPVEVKKFLWTYNSIIDTLFEAYKQIKIIFGENMAEIYLELNRDPEEDVEELFIIVKTNLSPDQSLALLNKLDETWWLYIDYEIRKILEIDIENIF